MHELSSVWTDGASNVSRPDPSGTDQSDAEHQATDLAVGGANPSRRATITAAQRLCDGLLVAVWPPDWDQAATTLAATP